MNELKKVLLEITNHETDYEIREILVYKALYLAKSLGLNAGIRIDQEEPEIPVVTIELPTGQVSWHNPQSNMEYDGHTIQEKYWRIHDFEPPEPISEYDDDTKLLLKALELEIPKMDKVDTSTPILDYEMKNMLINKIKYNSFKFWGADVKTLEFIFYLFKDIIKTDFAEDGFEEFLEYIAYKLEYCD